MGFHLLDRLTRLNARQGLRERGQEGASMSLSLSRLRIAVNSAPSPPSTGNLNKVSILQSLRFRTKDNNPVVRRIPFSHQLKVGVHQRHPSLKYRLQDVRLPVNQPVT